MTLCFWQVTQKGMMYQIGLTGKYVTKCTVVCLLITQKGMMYQIGLTGKYVTKCTVVCLLILNKFLVHLGKSLSIL